MKVKNKITLGNLGEEIAVKHLISLGFKIIDRNFKRRYGEIDIVALDGTTLVFVEVKTRRGDKFGKAEEAITYWKRKSLIKSAQYYKLLHPELPDSMRIDLVSVYLTLKAEVKQIELYKDITS